VRGTIFIIIIIITGESGKFTVLKGPQAVPAGRSGKNKLETRKTMGK
jgi:hypothetical protein